MLFSIIFRKPVLINSNMVVFSNGGGTQTFHLRAANEVERQKWVTALELAKAKVRKAIHVQ